jgi:hypothetical protein
MAYRFLRTQNLYVFGFGAPGCPGNSLKAWMTDVDLSSGSSKARRWHPCFVSSVPHGIPAASSESATGTVACKRCIYARVHRNGRQTGCPSPSNARSRKSGRHTPPGRCPRYLENLIRQFPRVATPPVSTTHAVLHCRSLIRRHGNADATSPGESSSLPSTNPTAFSASIPWASACSDAGGSAIR